MREQELQRQLDEYRAAKRQTLNSLDEALTYSDHRKREMWDAVAPLLKRAIESRVVKNGDWNQREIERAVYEKCVLAVLGPEGNKNLERLVLP